MMNPKRDPILYITVVEHMSALIDKYHIVGVPAQLKSEIWSRMLAKIRQHKFQQA